MSFGFGFGMAKAAAFLSGPVPSLNLQFAGATTLDPRITFTRASSATYFNSSGVLTSAGNNVARFDYNPTTLAPRGLLIEEQRTNLLTYSEDFTNAVWGVTTATVTSNSMIAPDGTQTADQLVETAGTGTLPRFAWIQTIVNATVYVISVYAKEVVGSPKRYLQVYANSGFTQVAGGSQGANFDLGAGTVTLTNGFTASITAIGNGWYRCTVITSASNATIAGFRIALQDSPTANMSAAWNPTGAGSIAVWGAQLEAGSFATSYIPTVAAQVTRSADSASMTGTNFSSWYNATEGTLYAEGSIPFVGGPNFPGLFTVDDGTVNNSATLYVSDGGADYPSFAGYSGGVNQWDIARPVAYTPNTVLKMAGAYKANDFSAAFSGVLGTPDTSGTVPTVTTARIGAVRGGNSPLNGWIRKVAFYPARLANATLQALTT